MGDSQSAPKGLGGYEFRWSQAEKACAREAINRALQRELQDLMAETKRRASRIAAVDDVWALVEYLSRRRKEIDARYDYRYSVLPAVLAVLIRAERMNQEELAGLSEDKLREIRRLANSRL